MKVSALLAVMLAGTALAQNPGQSVPLFSAAEAEAWNKVSQSPAPRYTPRDIPQPGVPSCRSLPDAATRGSTDPQIKIVAPALDRPLSTPLDIDVQFLAGATPVRPETFRVCYVGFLTIDITKRITDRVSVSPQGLHVSGADLPRGHHHLLMLIADQQGHFGQRDATFDIR